ncbi:hypothetical protein IAT38_001799 [Cryptococcus sp. DSM 104549]
MSLRNTSGKFSLSSFGRKVSGVQDPPSSPGNAPATSNGNHTYDDDAGSPTNSGSGFDGFGKKLKGSLAHQHLLPALGNKDVRALQDIISTEKGVLQMTEKLALETQKASACLPTYGIQEGPDLQDILAQSSSLLNHLTTALNVFAGHQANMRSCLKRIREREEQLAELRNRRRSTGTKADTAERKLAKMGPENKALPQQTELLERLRGEMRTMDQDIMTEETKIGDFKRQVTKEALSLKFGGLEELGEKMCIIGELGKLLLEEVPLEETPVGYGRAPYTGYEKTENAVNEATKCLATVQFHAASTNPKPPGLPQPIPLGDTLRAPSLPRHDESTIAAAEEYGHYPGGSSALSPEDKGKGRDYTLDNADPYGGISSNPYAPQIPPVETQPHMYSDFGGTRGGQVVFQGPTSDDAAHHPPAPAQGEVPAPAGGDAGPSGADTHDYEYEQQKQLDAEEAWKKLEQEEEAWRQQAEAEDAGALPNPHAGASSPPAETSGQHMKSPWEPLNVKRGNTPEPTTLYDGPSPPTSAVHPSLSEPVYAAPTIPPPSSYTPPAATGAGEYSPASSELAPPPNRVGATPTPGAADFYTPMGSPAPESNEYFMPAPPAAAASAPAPAPAVSNVGAGGPTPGGKISAAAFRRGAKPKTSLEPDESFGSSTGAGAYGEDSAAGSAGVRRLPVPPGAGPAEIALPASPAPGAEGEGQRHSPPPGYQTEESLR